MISHAYAIDSAKLKDVKIVLEADPFNDESFARTGYTLKEPGALPGFDNAKAYLLIETADAPKAQLLDEKAKKLEGVTALTGADGQKVIDAIHAEQDNAASGFGNIFG